MKIKVQPTRRTTMRIYEVNRDWQRGAHIYEWDVERETEKTYITSGGARLPKVTRRGVARLGVELFFDKPGAVARTLAVIDRRIQGLEDSKRATLEEFGEAK
jgi:hypothetical protein